MANLNLAQLQTLLRSVGFPESQIAKMAAIGIYESNGNPNAVNDGSQTNSTEYSVGIYQINTLAHHYSIAQLRDPVFNAQVALGLLRNRPNYGDWYNSNRKYESNYQGVAAQSRAIYTGGGDDTGGVIVSNINYSNDPSYAVDGTAQDDNSALYVIGGLIALALLL